MRRAIFLTTLLVAYAALAPAQAPSALQALEQKVQQDVQGKAAAPPLRPAASAPAAATPAAEADHERGYAGLLADDQADRGRGVRILKLEPGGPAEKAGLQPQDLITALDGVRVRQLSDMAMILEQVVPGQTMQVDVLRGDQTQRLPLTLGRPLARTGAAKPPVEKPPVQTPAPPAPGIASSQDSVQARLEQLERRIEQLEQRNQALEQRIQVLERALSIPQAK